MGHRCSAASRSPGPSVESHRAVRTDSLFEADRAPGARFQGSDEMPLGPTGRRDQDDTDPEERRNEDDHAEYRARIVEFGGTSWESFPSIVSIETADADFFLAGVALMGVGAQRLRHGQWHPVVCGPYLNLATPASTVWHLCSDRRRIRTRLTVFTCPRP